jgi:putative transposase
VNRSTYYKHFSSPPAARTLENQKLRQLILEIYQLTKKRLGPNKIHALLSSDYGIHISVSRVQRLMNGMHLPKMSTIKPKFIHSHSSLNFDHPNHVQQQFNVDCPNEVWVSDITYIKTQYGFVYLCVILDLFARKVIAWKVSSKMDVSLIKDCVQKALDSRKITSSLIFHSDRGSQYTSFTFRKFLDDANIIQSFSKLAHPWDNAVMESFFKYMKKEELNRRNFKTIQDVSLSCFEYIEGFYNSMRPHSANQMMTPNSKEDLYFNQFSIF